MPSLDSDANIHLPFPQSDWVITLLPFAPTAINDAGLIVGVQNGLAVQYQNGKVEVLPAGPVPIFMPTAITKHLAIVGNAGSPSAAFKWTPSDGFQFLNAQPRRTRGEISAFVTDINDNGLAVGIIEHDLEASPVVWLPDGNGLFRWPKTEVFGGRGNIHVNNHGDVAILDRDPTRNVSVLQFDGTVESFTSIPPALSVDAFSDEGRIIGTSTVNGATRAWTFYKNQLHWLDLPDGIPWEPSGVNSCGNIVGATGPDSGVLFARLLPSRCDGAGVGGHP